MKARADETQLIEQYWDNNVANWKVAAHLSAGSPEFFAEVERYRFEKLDYLPKVINYNDFKGQSVLDVGCGLATDLSRFARGGATVTGIDISQTAVDYAKQNFAQRELVADFEKMDGQQLDYDDNVFDFVYCHTVLHFTNDPAAMVAEIHRVLKPGGKALLMTINRASWLYFLHRVAGVKIDYLDSPQFNPFNYREFEALCAPFAQCEMLVERFPVRTEVHSGIKAFVYNTCFVDFYNALPRAVIGRTGYHLLARVQKSA
ncbi:MAG: class I SAM-dependent methyltransferase [Pseudomonadota bacterium]